jgi:hypothetical protein
MVRRRSFFMAFLVGALGALLFAPGAGAAITGSQITTPASTVFTTWSESEANSIVVSGTTSGGAPGDEVDIVCYSGAEVLPLETAVPLAPNGSFFVGAASVQSARAHVCRLRAVPAGTTPADPTAFAGPLLGTGSRLVERFPDGPSAGRQYGFFAEAQQLTAGGAFRSVGRCPVSAFLDNAALERTTTTFLCGSRFWRFNDYKTPPGTRSQIQVDGFNAHTPAVVVETVGGNSNFPALSSSFSQDPVTGDTVVHDNEAIVYCSPPPGGELCSSVAPTGVYDERTLEQTADGHLITVTDRYSSTDGQSHSIDLLPENIQVFAGPGEEHASSIGYRFPGQSAYSTHAFGDVVEFAGEAPGVVWIRVEGRADGDEKSGRGAIVFDRPASPAIFNVEEARNSGFEFHQAGSVPASGSTVFRSAYVQGYAQSEVEALVARAKASFMPPAAVPPVLPVSGGSGSSSKPPPGSTVHGAFGKIRASLDKRKGTVQLLVVVNGPGAVKLSGKDLVGTRASASGAGPVKLTVRAKGAVRRHLRKTGRASVRATLTFVPAAGQAVSTEKRLVLQKR